MTTLFITNVHFGFKKGVSIRINTAIVHEAISYYVHDESNVYGLMLDASKAFDLVNYCKLFRVGFDKSVCPLYCTDF